MTEPNTFFIYNLATNQVTVEAPSAEQILSTFKYSDHYFKPRGPEQIICEVPKMLGLNLHTFKLFPISLIIEGNKRWKLRGLQ